MKKFIAKLVLFSIISISLILTQSNFSNPNNPLLANAENGTDTTGTPVPSDSTILFEISNTIKSLQDDKKCIDATGNDKEYIITIIEEPLTLKESSTKTPNDDFESRICVRNNFSFVVNKNQESVSVLLKECNSEIQKFNQENADLVAKYGVIASCKPVQVLLSKGGTSLIEGYIGTIYRWAASIVGVIAVLVIIISGIQISIAGGETQAIDEAKGRIVKSLAGIVVLFLSGLILYTINPNFFVR